MKIEKPFSFTLFRDKKTNNFISVGKNAYYQKYFLKPTTESFNSELIEINQEIFNSFFLAENLETIGDFNRNIVINTKKLKK